MEIAQAYYFALTKGMDYVEQGAEKYLEQQRLRGIYVMKKLAKKYNYNIDESA
ncbi:MAG: hypothetical protein PHX50_17105 [Massilibacteroides sp.]|nr:hypothetical protein [Massilibacteroides sp.]